eukprot:COSAG02_NODE_1145_length_14241_cov_3.363951_6_plen_259_part_00
MFNANCVIAVTLLCQSSSSSCFNSRPHRSYHDDRSPHNGVSADEEDTAKLSGCSHLDFLELVLAGRLRAILGESEPHPFKIRVVDAPHPARAHRGSPTLSALAAQCLASHSRAASCLGGGGARRRTHTAFAQKYAASSSIPMLPATSAALPSAAHNASGMARRASSSSVSCQLPPNNSEEKWSVQRSFSELAGSVQLYGVVGAVAAAAAVVVVVVVVVVAIDRSTAMLPRVRLPDKPRARGPAFACSASVSPSTLRTL